MIVTIALGIVLAVIILRLIPLMISVVGSAFSFLLTIAVIVGLCSLAYVAWLIPVEGFGFSPIVVGTIYVLLAYYIILFGTKNYKKKMTQKEKEDEERKKREAKYDWMHNEWLDEPEDNEE
jgi:predicted membrane protein